jgi:phage-related protein
MPLPLSTIAIEEKNKLATDSVFLIALKITIPSTPSVFTVRLVNNSANISWLYENGGDDPWVAFPFSIEELTDQSGGEVPVVTLRISNVTRVMDVYLKYYDDYIKAFGYEPIIVNIYVINTAVIAVDPDANPEVEHVFELKKPSVDDQWATFVLSASNPYNRRFPQNRILKNHCRYKFEGSDGRCGHTGGPSCDHTLVTCRSLNNSNRFGGAPGVGKGGFEIY